MKHQQVVVDYWTMLKTSITCLLLAISGYVLIKMVQTIFYLPGYLKNNQKRLEELAAKYNLDLDKEIAEAEKEIENEENKNRESEIAPELEEKKDK
ncbi:uncharacterized protein LOC106083348 [Stomoxys calcitrans]|uniref:Uncharacterized protein n=1 Tax=Stomoxys calcitrans TaxID=35570 RepID=A0A1I8PWA0_STOCA|nr:uncharacterized protein LOC106083348 [Stomoxys calcitrans]